MRRTSSAPAVRTIYKGYVAKPDEGLVIAPTVSRDGAGATLQLRF
jgi:hypothetical protein